MQQIRTTKLSNVIERELEALILEGVYSPGQQLPPERMLAKEFSVSRPSLREAIQHLEIKGLLTRKQGGGTFVNKTLWQQFSDPLLNLLNANPESQFDLLEFRYSLEGLSSYFAALRGNQEDLAKINQSHDEILSAQQRRDLDAEVKAVIKYLIAVTEASHNIVLLHVMQSLAPILEHNILENFGLLNQRPEVVEKISQHRKLIVKAIMNNEPEIARQASHAHLAFIKETLICLGKEKKRQARSLRRSTLRKDN